MSLALRTVWIAALALTTIAAWCLLAVKPGAVEESLNGLLWFAAVTLSLILSLVLVGAILPQRLRRPVAFRFSAVTIAMFGALGCAELVLWLLPPPHRMDNPWYLLTGRALERHPELPFVRPGNFDWRGLSRGDLAILNGEGDPYAREVRFRTDADGFRNPDGVRDAPLVFLGDSFTEAGNVPVAETFVARVGARLGLGSRNLGRAGYSPLAERVILEEFGLVSEPRLVFWQISESNDLEEAGRFEDWVARGRPPLDEFDAKGQLTRAESWARRSPTARLFAKLRAPRIWNAGPEGVFRGADGVRYPMRMLHVPNPNRDLSLDPGFPLITRALSEGKRLADAKSTPILVFLIPMKFRALAGAVEFDEGVRSKLEARGLTGPDWEVPARSTLGYWLATFCRDAGIHFLDLTPTLRSAAERGERVYMPLDTHLDSPGHERVAKRLAEFTLERNLLR